MAGNRWSSDDIHRLVGLRNAGHTMADCAHIMGRSVGSIEGKLEYMGLSIDQRNARRAGLSTRRRREVADTTKRIHFNQKATLANRPAPDLLAERDRRLALQPRDLTAAFCGDPLPGYSALERRA